MSWILVQLRDCDVGRLSNFSNFENRTNFSLSQFIDYVDKYAYLQCSIVLTLKQAGMISFVVSGFAGLISYLLMFVTLKKIDISRCTLIYHKAIVVLELLHMLIMSQFGFMVWYQKMLMNTNKWFWNFWFDQLANGWVLGDSFKLAISTVTVFLTVERFVAVCLPLRFDRVNQKWVAYSAVVLGSFIGTAQLWQAGTIQVIYDQKSKLYKSLPTWFADNGFYNFVVNYIFGIKIGLGLLILALSVMTVKRLKIEAKKSMSMSSAARSEWTAKKKACSLAYIVGISIFFDHLVWVVNKIYRHQATDNSGEKAVLNLTYSDAVKNLEQRKMLAITELLQRVLGQLVHSWRFFLYLLFNQTIRKGFRKLFAKWDNQVSVSTHA